MPHTSRKPYGRILQLSILDAEECGPVGLFGGMAQYHSGALRIAIEKCGSEAAARTALLHLAEQHPRLVAQTTRETPLPSGIDISAFAEMK